MNIVKRLEPAEAKALGFSIDDTVYPWVAYKGPRFRPTAIETVYTILEANLMEEVERLQHFDERRESK